MASGAEHEDAERTLASRNRAVLGRAVSVSHSQQVTTTRPRRSHRQQGMPHEGMGRPPSRDSAGTSLQVHELGVTSMAQAPL